MNKKIAALGLASFAAVSAFNVNADTQSVTADVTFVAPVDVANPTALDFGNIVASIGNAEIVTVDSAGAVTGTGAASYLDGAAAGSVTINGVARTIDVEINNFSATNAAVFTIGSPTCDFNGGGETACATGDAFQVTGTGTDATMDIGMSLTIVSAPTAGDFAETFDVVAVYN